MGSIVISNGSGLWIDLIVAAFGILLALVIFSKPGRRAVDRFVDRVDQLDRKKDVQ